MSPRSRLQQPEFLPMSRPEMEALGWDELDVLLVGGDAYVDHPSFGLPLLGRWLVEHGYRVGLICQPDWKNPDSVKALGRPRLFAGVSSGALDSMLAHYTAFRKKRSDDAYTPGGKAGARPNRAVIVYSNLVRAAFKGLPLIIGGIEASLRRVAHYDFWADGLRRSILLDAKADLLIYGMAEKAILEAARRLERKPEAGVQILHGIGGTGFAGGPADLPGDADILRLPGLGEIEAEPAKLLEATLALEQQVHQGRQWVVQDQGGREVILAPPAHVLSSQELDQLYGLPYSRRSHPSYREPIPSEAMICTSITSHRGCGGGCSFCSLALHQGRRVRSRSRESILAEARSMAQSPGWKGSISDIGGPSANMWGASCRLGQEKCNRPSCLHPRICRHFQLDHGDGLRLLNEVQNLPGIRHLRVASGIRYDLALADRKNLEGIIENYVGGQLKIAPEHISAPVLELMRKPGRELFQRFIEAFRSTSRRAGKEQYIVPYLLSAFPGCRDDDMRELAAWLEKQGWKPQQVQCFIPTPGTVATAMFYAGINPKGEKIHVARSDRERLRQHGILMPGLGPGESGRQPGQGRKKRGRAAGRKPR